MKKLSLIILVLMGFLVFPLQVYAVDFDIEQTDIHAYLLENRNVDVEETHTYAFDGEFNGITRTLIAKEGTQITDVQATENGKPLKVEQDDNLYKIHRKGEDETITAVLSYTIENGLEVYSDLGQFYWAFFDDGNESDYENLNIFIHPPKPAEDPVFLGYDAAFGTGKTAKDGAVHFDLGHVGSGQKGDIRVAYDASLFPNVPSAGDKTIANDIQADRAEIEADIAAFEKRKDILSKIAPVILGAFGVYLVILLIRRSQYKQQVKQEAERRFVDDFFVPKAELSMPATIHFMNSGVLDANALSAALLDLIRKGYVKEEDEETFTVINRQTDFKHEQMLIAWLFDMIGSDGTFRMSDLESYTENEDNHEAYHQSFQSWRDSVKEEVSNAQLYEDRSKARWMIGGSSLLLVPAIVIFGIHELFGWMLGGILLVIALAAFALGAIRKTAKGVHIEQQWKDFSEKFADVAPTEWNEWLDDDQKRAFIYGLGCNNKTIQEKSQVFMEQGPRYADIAHAPGTNMFLFMAIAGTFQHQFDKADTAAAASLSAGGGTPGVGGGVGGGGGGSGAF
ncbi:hypothetical protein JNUCC1_02413 [Lentibacillus sp. JNUCC-1]|uniref:DUF2207 domain-containing protein n=1 Tax=Lentibacillus sp. JNUCC-1 TaxID=2654513 RepID=UPI0012E932F2|nr:DUF2207 domain-containing protein [Lentibacillus sp. JNUCC-1]MUV38559.1 hypothetical protein [Lentibacillus sp. JNUCC-1]